MRVAAIVALLPAALAWDAEGHAAIGMTVMSGVKGDALTQLKRLLQGKDVVDIASWSGQVVKKYPVLDSMFFQMQDRDLTVGPVDCNAFNATDPCPGGVCLVNAAKYFYSKLVGQDELAPEEFKMPVNLKLTDTDHLKFLIAVLGEIHEPMRFGYRWNDAGRGTRIHFNDNGKNKQSTLFHYWDSDLVQKTIRDRPNFWYSGWTHLNSLGRHFYDHELSQWDQASFEERLKLFEVWAADSFFHMCSRLQRKHPVPRQNLKMEIELKMLVPHDQVFTVQNIYMDFEALKAKILTAGIRTSIVINSILKSRDARKLRQGSGVKIPLAKPEFEEVDAFSRWTRNLGINIVIIAGVVVVFGMFVKFSSGVTKRQGVTPTAKVKN